MKYIGNAIAIIGGFLSISFALFITFVGGIKDFANALNYDASMLEVILAVFKLLVGGLMGLVLLTISIVIGRFISKL
jgi:hypothetical protein